MAAATTKKSGDSEEEFLECGLCYENDNLKRLPCSPGHIFCVTCLTKDSEVTKIIKCAICSAVFDEGIDAISAAGAPLDKFLCCDVCIRKDEKLKLAQIYCVICQKKFCKPHMDSHNDALDDHRRITMDEYKKEYRKVEVRHCETHKDQVYSLACEECNEVFCAKCMLRPTLCTDGSPHRLVDIQLYVADFLNKINDIKVWIFDKEEHLLGIVKQLTRILSDWDNDTERMIAELHEARDRHLEKVREKYTELEQTFRKLRGQSRDEVTQYLDVEVGEQLEKITRGVKKLDARIYSHHQVDVVRGMKDTEDLAKELKVGEVPKYHPSASNVKLVNKDMDLRPSIEIASCEEIVEEMIQSYTPSAALSPPKSMKLLKSVNLEGQDLESVCHYKGFTYAGRENAVDKIHPNGTVESSFISVDNYTSGIMVHEDKIFLLGQQEESVYSYVSKVLVHNLSGKMIRSWKAAEGNTAFNKLTVVGDRVVVPEASNKQLVVYGFDGNVHRRVECDLLQNCSFIENAVSVTSSESYKTIVSVKLTGTVIRIDIESGEVLWKSTHVGDPEGIVCYKDRYVLVVNSNQDARIFILDINTGEYLGEMHCERHEEDTSKYDLAVDGDTLIVAHFNPPMVEYYQLM